jgi:DNA-binding CsgD family transcriptional regulator
MRIADEELIGRIYEAAIAPDRWLSVLNELSNLADGDGTLILTRNDFQERWLGSGRAKALFGEGIADGWHNKNPRAERLFASHHAGFLNDLDVFTHEEIHHEPYFTEYLHPRGMGWGAATAIEVPSGDMIAFDVERRYERGPVERNILDRLDTFRPHLARATLISSRLAFEQARSAVETLRLIGLPAAVLAPRGYLRIANDLFEKFVPSLFEDRAARLAAVDELADALLAETCERIARRAGTGGVGSIPISARAGYPPMILHVVPLIGVANDVFSAASALLVITAVEPKKVPTAKVIQGLFDLTPGEARVARAIAEGTTLNAIAATHGLSTETVRTQLKAALRKTGSRRQAELASLLAGAVFQE